MFSSFYVILFLCVFATETNVRGIIDNKLQKLAAYNSQNAYHRGKPVGDGIQSFSLAVKKGESLKNDMQVGQGEEEGSEPIDISKDGGEAMMMKLRGECGEGKENNIGDEVHDWCDVVGGGKGKNVVERCTKDGWVVVQNDCEIGWHLRFYLDVSLDPNQNTLAMLKTVISTFEDINLGPREITFVIKQHPKPGKEGLKGTYKEGQKLSQELVGEVAKLDKLAGLDEGVDLQSESLTGVAQDSPYGKGMQEIRDEAAADLALAQLHTDFARMDLKTLSDQFSDRAFGTRRLLAKTAAEPKDETTAPPVLAPKKPKTSSYHPKLRGRFRLEVTISPEYGRAESPMKDMKKCHALLQTVQDGILEGSLVEYISKTAKIECAIDPKKMIKYFKNPPPPPKKPDPVYAKDPARSTTTTTLPQPAYLRPENWNTIGPSGEKPHEPVPVPTTTTVTLSQSYSGITDCAASVSTVQELNAKALGVAKEKITATPGAGCSGRAEVRRYLGSSVSFNVAVEFNSEEATEATRVASMSGDEIKTAIAEEVASDPTLSSTLTVESCSPPEAKQEPQFCSGIKSFGKCGARPDCKFDNGKCVEDPDATTPPPTTTTTTTTTTTRFTTLAVDWGKGEEAQETVVTKRPVECFGIDSKNDGKCEHGVEEEECINIGKTVASMPAICKYVRSPLLMAIMRKIHVVNETTACSADLKEINSDLSWEETVATCKKDLSCMGYGKVGTKIVMYDTTPYISPIPRAGSCYSLTGVRLPPPERKGKVISSTKACAGKGVAPEKTTTKWKLEEVCGYDMDCKGYSVKGKAPEKAEDPPQEFVIYSDVPTAGTEDGSCYEIVEIPTTLPPRQVVIVSNDKACGGSGTVLANVTTIDQAEHKCQQDALCLGYSQQGDVFFAFDSYPHTGEADGKCFQLTDDGNIVTTTVMRYVHIVSTGHSCEKEGPQLNVTSIELAEDWCEENMLCKGFGFNMNLGKYYWTEETPEAGGFPGACFKMDTAPAPTTTPAVRKGKMLSLTKACGGEGRQLANITDMKMLERICVDQPLCEGFGFKMGFYFVYEGKPEVDEKQNGICYEIVVGPPGPENQVKHAALISERYLCQGEAKVMVNVTGLAAAEHYCSEDRACNGFGSRKEPINVTVEVTEEPKDETTPAIGIQAWAQHSVEEALAQTNGTNATAGPVYIIETREVVRFYSFSNPILAGTENGTCYKLGVDVPNPLPEGYERTSTTINGTAACEYVGTRVKSRLTTLDEVKDYCLNDLNCNGYSYESNGEGTFYIFDRKPNVGTAPGSCHAIMLNNCFMLQPIEFVNGTFDGNHTTCPPTTTTTTQENFIETTGEWTTPESMATPTEYPSTSGAAAYASDELADTEFTKSFWFSDWVFYPLLAILLTTAGYVTYSAMCKKHDFGDHYQTLRQFDEMTESTFADIDVGGGRRVSCITFMFAKVRALFDNAAQEPYGNLVMCAPTHRLVF